MKRPANSPPSPSLVWPDLLHRLPFSLLLVILLPPLLDSDLWLEVWRGFSAQAWDGSGHFALGQLYSATTFPDTFGWTNAYFGGMGFPNFYPPLFYWLTALLAHTHLFTYATAFKLVLLLPTLLLPAAVWLLAWRFSAHNRLFAACAALALLPLLVDERFTNSIGLMGLSHTSTLLLGLYSQPLGFVLLLAFYAFYVSADIGHQLWRAALSALLLALSVLANVFSANLAALFVLVTAGHDAWRLFRLTDPLEKTRMRRALLAHLLLVPLTALCLTMFWLAPLLNTYAYVVTRPESTAFSEMVPTALWGWYALAALGSYLWLRHHRLKQPTSETKTETVIPYLIACLLLAIVVLCGPALAPRWFPFHAPRLASTLDFLLALPVGWALYTALQLIGFRPRRPAEVKPPSPSRAVRQSAASRRNSGTRLHLQDAIIAVMVISFASLLVMALIKPARSGWAFYDAAEWPRIAPVLQFAASHRDGRYLVESLPLADLDAAHDGRAINAYLGAQGNETLSLFFREAAPNVIFLNPLVDALSLAPNTYGISSVLADDQSYFSQPLSQHLAQARLFGTKYLVMHSPMMKERLAAAGGIKQRFDVGDWSIFELDGEPAPRVRALAYKPALVVSHLSFKERRRNQYDFVRFVEEQFNEGWFDVLLALAPETRIDRLKIPDGFGALILDTYTCADEPLAFERLREFAQHHQLILLSSEAPLFRHLQRSIAELPQAQIITRPAEAPGTWLDSDTPTMSYEQSAIRRVWQQLHEALDQHKIAVAVAVNFNAQANGAIPGESKPNQIDIVNIDPGGSLTEAVPVLVSTTYHPDWQRTDGAAVYPATPFFMLTFVQRPTALVFARRTVEWLGVWLSAGTLLLLCGVTGWHYRSLLSIRRKRKNAHNTAARE